MKLGDQAFCFPKRCCDKRFLRLPRRNSWGISTDSFGSSPIVFYTYFRPSGCFPRLLTSLSKVHARRVGLFLTLDMAKNFCRQKDSLLPLNFNSITAVSSYVRLLDLLYYYIVLWKNRSKQQSCECSLIITTSLSFFIGRD